MWGAGPSADGVVCPHRQLPARTFWRGSLRPTGTHHTTHNPAHRRIQEDQHSHSPIQETFLPGGRELGRTPRTPSPVWIGLDGTLLDYQNPKSPGVPTKWGVDFLIQHNPMGFTLHWSKAGCPKETIGRFI